MKIIITQGTYEICTVGVKLATIVIRLQVELGLVEERDNLEVRRRTEELHTRDRASGDKPCAAAGFGAPCDLLALRVANGGRAAGRGPHAPVCAKYVVISGSAADRRKNHAPSTVLMNAVWQSELAPSVVELQML